jgi:hypothetical protein
MRQPRAQAALVIGTPICGTIFSNDEKICCENAGLRSDRSANKFDDALNYGALTRPFSIV